jgi:hypothetical protein
MSLIPFFCLLKIMQTSYFFQFLAGVAAMAAIAFTFASLADKLSAGKISGYNGYY